MPTCCSCHIDGYREEFPPSNSFLGNAAQDYRDDFHFASNKNKYSTIFEDEDDFDDYDTVAKGSVAYQYSNGFRKSPVNNPQYATSTFSYADVKLGHHTPEITKKSRKPTNTIDTYLTPPTSSDPFDGDGSFQRRIRRPQRKHIRDPTLNGASTGGGNNYNGLNGVSAIGGLSGGYHQQTTFGDQMHQTKRRVSIASVSPNDRKKQKANINIPLPSISTASTSVQDLGKRVNYNYHPIIDFFSEGMPGRAKM